MMEEEKVDENPFNMREAELTQSEYSHYSYLSSFDKKSVNNKSHRSSTILVRDRAERSNPSIIINRVNDSKEKAESNNGANSPLTSNRLSKRITEPLQRNSFVEPTPK
jgi:hypothetical protein